FSRFLRTLFKQDWIVYSKPPFGGPDHVLQYLARYTHRVAISNHRIVSVTESEVRFRWKDYANHSKKRTNDPRWRRVPSTVLATYPAQGFPADSLLRMVGQSEARITTSTLPSRARSDVGTGPHSVNTRPVGGSTMSEVPWPNAHR